MRAAKSVERAYYSAPIKDFLSTNADEVLGRLTAASEFSVDPPQRDAWQREIAVLRNALLAFAGRGRIYLEFVVPRLGKRIDAVVLVDHVIFVVEFKVGEKSFAQQDVQQVWDYALDLKNFHESSHAAFIAPVLVVTGARGKWQIGGSRSHQDGVAQPTLVSADLFAATLEDILGVSVREHIEPDRWEQGRYRPTPTIVEAAAALYRGHAVGDISRNDAGATNLSRTAETVSQIIERSRERGVKSICLVTGVPGAGKTLVGLDIATRYLDAESDLHSVYLSGNGPLVAILREALARDDVRRAKERGAVRGKGEARQAVKAFI